MEKNIITQIDVEKYTIILYPDCFEIIKKKNKWLFAFSEILTIHKNSSSFNGGVSYEYHIDFKAIDKFKARSSFTITLKNYSHELSLILDQILEFAYSDEFKNQPYPKQVELDRVNHINSKPFGTNAWEYMWIKHSDIGTFFVAVPLINIISIPWLLICSKYFHY